MKLVSKRFLKTKRAQIIWSSTWSVLLVVFGVFWLYRAFDTGSMWDYLITIFSVLASVSFAIDVKELVFPVKSAKPAK